MPSRSPGFHGPVGASVFAGILGAGLCDAAAILVADPTASPAGVVLLAVALYGLAGLAMSAAAAWLLGEILRTIPGPDAVARDPALDDRIATWLVAGAAATLFLAAGLMAGQVFLISRMASARLAALAAGGLGVGLVPLAVVVALTCQRTWARRITTWLPRVWFVGRAGIALALLAAAALLGAGAALAQADWRVFNLKPAQAAGVAVILGLAHGIFWYAVPPGRRLHLRLPVAPIRAVTVMAVMACAILAARIPEQSPTYRAITDEGAGLPLLLDAARKLADRDHDGFSAILGGGDCDDHNAGIFPGAEDPPGDGIDQNCEGGDAKTDQPSAELPAAANKIKAAARRSTHPFAGNILIISIDALRADRLGVAGYARPVGRSLTPNLDALANRGAYFRRVWAQAPNTPRSFPSLLTSRYPSEILWQQRQLNYSPISESNETFFDRLGRAGLRPVGIFSHFYFTADRGISKGFAEWSNDGAGTIAQSNKDVAAPRIVPRVIERLQRAAGTHERFVLWTHLFEPHSSYMDHSEFPATGAGVAGLEERYDYEITFVDLWIGKIISALHIAGLEGNTAVVVLADHGEAWGEHKRYFHGQDLTEEQLRVPLIMAIPGRQPSVIDDDAALVDVGPTLLDLVGAPIPTAFRGRSLLSRIDGQPLPTRPIFAEMLPATAWPKHEVMIVDRGKKLTHRITDRRYTLHDLASDPREQKDLASDPTFAPLLAQLKARLLAFEERKR